MVRKTELTLAEKLAVLVEYGKKHGISATAYSIAHATKENTTNIQRILNGENSNPGLRTLTAITGHFGVGLGYFDCKTESECQAYLAELEAKQVQTEISEKQILGEIAKRSSGLGPEGLQVLKTVADYLQIHGKGRSRK
jgi:transcriptional regulator with XRE-family HTH domain